MGKEGLEVGIRCQGEGLGRVGSGWEGTPSGSMVRSLSMPRQPSLASSNAVKKLIYHGDTTQTDIHTVAELLQVLRVLPQLQPGLLL